MFRYSLQRYSLTSKVKYEFNISAYFVENIQALLGIGSDAVLENIFAENIKGNGIITRTAPLKANFNDAVWQGVTVGANFPIKQVFREAIVSVTAIVKNCGLTVNFTDNAEGTIYISKNTPLTAAFSQRVEAAVLISKNIYLGAVFGEIIYSVISIVTLDEDKITINVTIPPGGELVINSELYLVTLNGVNIIHLHKGDWISLSKDTTHLIADTSTGGNLSGQMLYRERYL